MARFHLEKNINFRKYDRVTKYNIISLGLMSGPFIGSGLDKLFGYQYIFYAMGALFLLSIIPTVLLVPKD